MKIAVTGARGRVGSAVVDMALKQGHTVVSIDRVEPNAEHAKQANVTCFTFDMENYQALEDALRGCEGLIHLAAIPSPNGHPPQVVHNNNVVGSYNALTAAVNVGIKKVAQASSVNAIGSAYSRAPRYDYFPIDEAHPTYNEDPYSLSKWICEQQGDSFARRYEDMTIASMRFHWVVPDRAYAVEHLPHIQDSVSKHLWGYTTYDAAARACLLTMTAPWKGHEAFFIIGPETTVETPSRELAAKYFPATEIRGDFAGNTSFFNSTQAERLLGWKHNQA